jgi:hypothetical protein
MGLKYLKYTDKEITRIGDRTKNERFASHYGFSPTTVAQVINDNPDIDTLNLFMTFAWWTAYDTEHRMNSHWKFHEETTRKKVVGVCEKLAMRMKDKIIFGKFVDGQVLLATIDCVHFEWQERRTDPGSKWYSHKHNGPGVSYEVCVDAVKNRIVWASGPFPAATHDITIFRGGKAKEKHKWRKSSLYHLIPEGKRLVGDSGYVGEPDKVSCTLGGHSAKTKELFARLKSRQESLFRRYKSLNIMGGAPFRHKGKQGGGSQERMRVHGLVFDAITVVIQYGLESDDPLFDV